MVSLNGRAHYLGEWNTPESRAEYDRLIAEWLAAGRGRPKAEEDPDPGDPTVAEVLLAFWKHAETPYRDPDGVPTPELKNLRESLKSVRRLYSKAPAREFGPRPWPSPRARRASGPEEDPLMLMGHPAGGRDDTDRKWHKVSASKTAETPRARSVKCE